MKTYIKRVLSVAGEGAFVVLQCVGILALFLLAGAVFNLMGGYPPFFWM